MNKIESIKTTSLMSKEIEYSKWDDISYDIRARIIRARTEEIKNINAMNSDNTENSNIHTS